VNSIIKPSEYVVQNKTFKTAERSGDKLTRPNNKMIYGTISPSFSTILPPFSEVVQHFSFFFFLASISHCHFFFPAAVFYKDVALKPTASGGKN
jgi:hypothetical protein